MCQFGTVFHSLNCWPTDGVDQLTFGHTSFDRMSIGQMTLNPSSLGIFFIMWKKLSNKIAKSAEKSETLAFLKIPKIFWWQTRQIWWLIWRFGHLVIIFRSLPALDTFSIDKKYLIIFTPVMVNRAILFCYSYPSQPSEEQVSTNTGPRSAARFLK